MLFRSPLSGYLAFFCAQPAFDRIYELAKARESRMSLYVDDITFSGRAVSKRFISEVRSELRHSGLKSREAKSKTFAAYAPKLVTGVVVMGDEIRLPNARHNKIHVLRKSILIAQGEEKEKLSRALIGHLQEAQYIRRAAKK